MGKEKDVKIVKVREDWKYEVRLSLSKFVLLLGLLIALAGTILFYNSEKLIFMVINVFIIATGITMVVIGILGVWED